MVAVNLKIQSIDIDWLLILTLLGVIATAIGAYYAWMAFNDTHAQYLASQGQNTTTGVDITGKELS
jgi:hypothetical protein